MFAAIFEVQPEQGKFDEYLSLAEFLHPKLEAIDGFVEINRFANERTSRRVLSLSTWRDEKAVVRWRTQAAQEKGRFEVFEDHRLRVGEVIADTALAGEQRFDATEAGRAKAVTLTELMMKEEGASSRGPEADLTSA